MHENDVIRCKPRISLGFLALQPAPVCTRYIRIIWTQGTIEVYKTSQKCFSRLASFSSCFPCTTTYILCSCCSFILFGFCCVLQSYKVPTCSLCKTFQIMSHIVRSANHIKDTKSSSRLILVKLLFRLVILGIWLCYYVQKFLPCLNNNFVYDIVCQKILVYWEALE